MLGHNDEASIGPSKEKRSYIGNNSIDYSEMNSIGYQLNAFNSNQILGNIFNLNNSNTFLMGIDSKPNLESSIRSPIKIEPKLEITKKQVKSPEQASPKAVPINLNQSASPSTETAPVVA